MENQSDGNESEQIADSFLCCVCLDLLYKPVVLACGHGSCFWCVHNCMNGLRESHCPICRHPYHHFPTICQMLHALLLKMYPLTYKRRENQTLEEEVKMGFFSPNFNDIGASHAKQESCNVNVEAQSSIARNPEDISKNDPYVQNNSYKASSRAGDTENSLAQSNSKEISRQVLIDDVLCANCTQLLFRPVVLNCGHVYCENCLAPADGPLKCQICQSLHPRGFPKVYLELDHFIEERFKEEYVARKNTIQVRDVESQLENQVNGPAKEGKNGFQIPIPPDENLLRWCADSGSKVHFGYGCDYCGLFPIIGDRYKCKDCKETVGFDLCGECYNTKSKLPGRFNQQHTPDHTFESVDSNLRYNMILRVLGDQSGNGPQLQDPVPENDENIFSPWVVVENAGNGDRIQIPVPENAEHIFTPWVVRENPESGTQVQDPVPENDENIFYPWGIRENADNGGRLQNHVPENVEHIPESGTRIQEHVPENEEDAFAPWIIRVNVENGPSTPGLSEDNQDDDDDTQSTE